MTNETLISIDNKGDNSVVTGSTGKTYTMDTKLLDLFVELTSEAPMALAAFVKEASSVTNISGGKIRGIVQQLAQPGQYHGSSCIGALDVSVPAGGKRAYIQFGKVGSLRAKLTRKNTPLSAHRSKDKDSSEEVSPVEESA